MNKHFSKHLSLSKIERIFWHAKFPKRKSCIRCGYRQLFKLSDDRYKCKRCRKKFSLFTNTYLNRAAILSDELYELLWWFVYGFTANKTAKEIELPQKLVHHYFFTIRKGISDYEENEMEKFFGEVEVDETYVGPKFKNRKKKKRDYLRKMNAVKRGRGSKILHQPVFGIYQRNGKVYIKFVKDVSKKILQDIIKGRIVLESEVYSDTLLSYHGLDKKGYHHETVDHGRQEYFKKKQNKKIHINGIEGFWGYMKEHLLKHHGIAKNNLLYYVKEQEFRFNYRHLSTEEMIQKLVEILVKFGPRND